MSAVMLGQDIHFSQFYNAPTILNPAFTGFINGKSRVGINYRNQWFSAVNKGFFKAPYMTTAITGDMAFKVKKDVAGLGLVFVNDQAGANTFSTFMIMASGSYIKSIGRERNHRLSAGFQIGYSFQNIRTENFEFANQFQDNIFVPTLPHNEVWKTNRIGFLNLNAGLAWYGVFAEMVGVYLGGSFFNISMPKYNMLSNESKNMYWRWNAHGGLDISLKKKYHILLSGMFMRQSVNDQLNTGIGFGMDFKERYSFTFGFYNRIHNLTTGVTKDALIPYTAIEMKGFKLGMSYDVTISDLKTVSSSVGGIELSVQYSFQEKNFRKRRYDLQSPRF
jgi:type IX secretion system PorP/SprF family membrane protein